MTEAQTFKPEIVRADFAAIELRILASLPIHEMLQAPSFGTSQELARRGRAIAKELDFLTMYGASTSIKDGYVQPRPEPKPPVEQPK